MLWNKWSLFSAVVWVSRVHHSEMVEVGGTSRLACLMGHQGELGWHEDIDWLCWAQSTMAVENCPWASTGQVLLWGLASWWGVSSYVHSPSTLYGLFPLLQDEPSSGMDPCSKRYLWKAIMKEVWEGCAVVLTSHRWAHLERLGAGRS